MTLNTDHKKTIFITEARSRLKKIYSYGSVKTARKEELQHEIHGFFQAGLLLNIITKQKIDELINEEHMNAFGKTKKQRRIDEKIDRKTETNWGKYDEPTYQRK